MWKIKMYSCSLQRISTGYSQPFVWVWFYYSNGAIALHSRYKYNSCDCLNKMMQHNES